MDSLGGRAHLRCSAVYRGPGIEGRAASRTAGHAHWHAGRKARALCLFHCAGAGGTHVRVPLACAMRAPEVPRAVLLCGVLATGVCFD